MNGLVKPIPILCKSAISGDSFLCDDFLQGTHFALICLSLFLTPKTQKISSTMLLSCSILIFQMFISQENNGCSESKKIGCFCANDTSFDLVNLHLALITASGSMNGFTFSRGNCFFFSNLFVEHT